MSLEQLLIRRAGSDDACLLSELGARTFSATFAEFNTPDDMAAYLAASFNTDQQAAELADPASVFLIAEVQRVARGYAKLRAGQPETVITGEQPIELVRMYVTPDCIRQGVGSALMQACLDQARRMGHLTMWLGVWEKNDRAKAFYDRWNLREVGAHVFLLGSDRQRDILMARSI